MRSVSERIRKIFESTEAEVIFLMNTDQQDSNFLYLTEFTGGVFEQNALIITRKKLILPVSILEYEIAKEQRPKEMQVIKITSAKQMKSIFKKYMKAKVVGINGSFLPYRYYKSISKWSKPKKIIDVSKAFYAARSIKEKDEISNIRVANKIAKKAVESARKQLKIGMTEKKVAAMLDYLMMENGADGVAFKTIVSFNSNAALPHHSPDNTKLKSNSIVLIDMGAKYNNYCSDITRTFMFKPEVKSTKYRRFKEIYETVEKAQLLGRTKIKADVLGSDAHNAVSDYINSVKGGKYKGLFIHSLGHAIGIDVHDWGPGLNSSKEMLKEGMVVSNEPGIYIVGFSGVRLEEDILVTKKGAEVI